MFKKLLAPLPFVITFLVFFFTTPDFQKRIPATSNNHHFVKTCFSKLSNFLDKREEKIWKKTAQRKRKSINGKILTDPVLGKRYKDYIVNFWNSYKEDVYVWDEKVNSSRKYFSWIRRMNQSIFIPRLFQSKNRMVRGVDTVNTILWVADREKKLTTNEETAMKNVRSWIEYAKEFKSKAHDQVFLSYYNHSLELESFNESVEKLGLKKSNFPEEGLSILYDTVVRKDTFDENGFVEFDVVRTGHTFLNWNEVENFRTVKEYDMKPIYTQNGEGPKALNELTDNSRFYDVFLGQAYTYRRLELTYAKLRQIPEALLDDEQKQLKKDIYAFLKDPEYRPRTQEMNRVKRREFWAEFYSIFWKKKSAFIMENKELEPHPSFIEMKKKATGPLARLIQGSIIFSVLAVPTAIFTNIQATLNENPWISYITASINQKITESMYELIGSSSTIAECQNLTREWSFNEVNAWAVTKGFITEDMAEERLKFYEKDRVRAINTLEYNNLIFKLNNECIVGVLERGGSYHHAYLKKMNSQVGLASGAFSLFTNFLYEELELKETKLSKLDFSAYMQDFFFYNDYVVEFDVVRDFRDPNKTKEIKEDLSRVIGKEKTDELFAYIIKYYQMMKETSLSISNFDKLLNSTGHMLESASMDAFMENLIEKYGKIAEEE